MSSRRQIFTTSTCVRDFARVCHRDLAGEACVAEARSRCTVVEVYRAARHTSLFVVPYAVLVHMPPSAFDILATP
jgi:hypothetical protein